jgi:hypothetical protein
VKRFVKGGDEGAEAYENVRVIFISGRKAVLTIYHDDKEVEQIELQTLETTQAMHELMIDRGFTKKSENELGLLRQRRLQDEEKDAKAKQEKVDRKNLQREVMREENALKRQIEEEGLGKDSPEYIKLMQAKEKRHKEIMEKANANKHNAHTLHQEKVMSEQLRELRNGQFKGHDEEPNVGDSASSDRLDKIQKRRLQAEEYRAQNLARASLEKERKEKEPQQDAEGSLIDEL